MRTWSLHMESDEMAHRAGGELISQEEVHFIWVVWGEAHIREALANARVCRGWNKYRNPGIRYFVYILDDWHNIPPDLLKKQKSHGIEIIERPGSMPQNQALFDVDRLKIMAEHDVPTMYIDTDLYVLCPIPLDQMGTGMKTFGMGLGRLGFDCNPIHGMVEEVLDYPSTIYYKDIGLDKHYYESREQFWPWIRINMGQIWCGTPALIQEFAESFAAMNTPFAQTRYFGVGEMVFTAMHNAGQIPRHEFDWRNGWNKIWPFIKKVESHLGVIQDDNPNRALGVYPVAHHDVLHVGHFGVQTHMGWTEFKRPLQICLMDDDSIELTTRFVNTPKAFRESVFPGL